MDNITHQLRQLQDSLKRRHQLKQEEKQKIEENIRRQNFIDEVKERELQGAKLERKDELKPMEMEEDVDFNDYLEDQKSKFED